jgi:4-oxalocrotonate tautomerase
MPILTVNLIKGRTLEQKRNLVKALTDAVCSTVDATPNSVRIILNEMQEDNYAFEGTLIADKKK